MSKIFGYEQFYYYKAETHRKIKGMKNIYLEE